MLAIVGLLVRILILFPLVLVMIAFAVSNRQQISLALWPFETVLMLPLWLVVFLPLAAGLLGGALLMGLPMMGLQLRHQRLNRQLKNQQQKNQNLVQQTSTDRASS